MAQIQAWSQARTFEAPAMYAWTFDFLVEADGSESMGGMLVTPNYFQTLGVKPLLGRLPTLADAARDKVPPTAVLIGHDLWRRKFNSDPNILGKPLRERRAQRPVLPIVGVMPPGMRFLPDPARPKRTELRRERAGRLLGRHAAGRAAPRLAARDTLSAGCAAARRSPKRRRKRPAISAALARDNPEMQQLTDEGRIRAGGAESRRPRAADAAVRIGRARLLHRLRERRGPAARARPAAPAGIHHASGARRGPRAPVPPGDHRKPRRRLIGAAGRRGSRRRQHRRAEGDRRTGDSTRRHGDRRMAGAGLRLPRRRRRGRHRGAAARRARVVHRSLPRRERLARERDARRTPPARRGRDAADDPHGRAARRRGAADPHGENLEAVRAGYETENILAMTVTTVNRDKWKEFHTQALDRVATVPGVKYAAFAWGLPLTGNKWPGRMHFPGEPGSPAIADKVELPLRAITQDYFKVMGMTLVEGREFRLSDDNQAPRVIVVNEALVRQYFRGEQPIGRRIFFDGDTKRERPLEIVGIVKDTRTEALNERPEPEIYQSLWQGQAFSKHMVVRTAGDPLPIAALVQRELRNVDPTSAVEKIMTMAEIKRQSMATTTSRCGC